MAFRSSSSSVETGWSPFAFQRGQHGMPGEDGALDAGGKFVDAGEHGQLADGRRPPSPVVTMSWTWSNRLFTSAFVLPLSALGQQRGGGLRDAAAGAQKADVLDHVAVHPREEGVVVAAERIVCPGRCRSASGSTWKFRGFLQWSRMTCW